MEEYILSHLNLVIKDKKQLEQYSTIHTLSNIKEDIDYTMIECDNHKVLLRKIPQENLLFRVRTFQHKQDKSIKIEKLEPISKFNFIYSSQNLLQDFHYEPIIQDEKLIENIKHYQNDHQQFTEQQLQDSRTPASFMKNFNQKINKINLSQLNKTSQQQQKDLEQTHLSYIQIRFQDDVPQKSSIQISKDLNDPFYTTIQELFNNRPIWIRNSLVYQLQSTYGNINLQQLKKYLRSLAFMYKDGPWKYCYVKFGYDPKQDINSILYQSFEISTGSEQSRYSNPYLVYDPTLVKIPQNYRSRYQFCDINDKQFKNEIGKTIRQAEEQKFVCKEKYGWFKHQVYRHLINLAKQRIVSI